MHITFINKFNKLLCFLIVEFIWARISQNNVQYYHDAMHFKKKKITTPFFITYRTFNLTACTILFIPGSNLRAVYSNSQITTSNITVWWNHPYQDADLVQSYNVSLRERSNSYNYKASVELQTNYTFESSFSPSFLYFFEITSNVLLSDPEETFTVKTNTINLVVGKKSIKYCCWVIFLV